MRNTTQRSLVLEYVRSTKTHPDASEVYSNVKKRLPGISLSTVYRTLAYLRDKGEVIELRGPDGVGHYDGDVADHAHFSCVSCGKLWDIESSGADTRALERAGRMGFEVHGSRLEVFGLCSGCQQKEDK